MPARTLNDFFAGFLMAISEPILRVTDTDHGHACVPKRSTPACRHRHVIF